MALMTRALLAVAAAVVALTGVVAQNKDIPAETARLLKELNVSAGGTVADIGAGDGEMTVEVARQLGAASRVYSTDINPKTVEALKTLVARDRLDNVVVVEGHANRTNLPDGCCDAIFVRHVYHHFGDPPAMNASIRRALKPGGRFAVMDFAPRKGTAAPVPPALRSDGDTHGVTPETVVEELKTAGFTEIQLTPEWPGGLFFVRALSPRSAGGNAPGTRPW